MNSVAQFRLSLRALINEVIRRTIAFRTKFENKILIINKHQNIFILLFIWVLTDIHVFGFYVCTRYMFLVSSIGFYKFLLVCLMEFIKSMIWFKSMCNMFVSLHSAQSSPTFALLPYSSFNAMTSSQKETTAYQHLSFPRMERTIFDNDRSPPMMATRAWR